MPLNAGKLRHRVVIQRQVETRNSLNGAVIVSWQPVDTVWADISPISAREFVTSQVELSKITTRITIRYRDDVTAKMRLYHAAKNCYYNIEGILADKESGLEYLTLPCSDGVREYISDPEDVLPVNLVAPVISGTAEVGEILSTTTGLWANEPTSYTYQWYRGVSTVIAGATSATYLLTLADEGLSVYCNVTASNGGGGANLNTLSYGPVVP